MKRKTLFMMASAVIAPLTVVALSGVAQADVAGVAVTFTPPTTVIAGAAATTFTGSAQNTSSTDYATVRYDIVFTGDTGLKTNQLTLQYLSTAPSTYTTIPLTGTTAAGGSITGFFGPSTGFPFPHGANLTTTFRISAAADAPLGTLHAAVTLDTVNGSGTVTGTLASASGDTTIVSQFSDVSTTNPFGPAIDELAAQGIILGYGGGATFHPLADVTRQAFAAYMARILGLASGTGTCTAAQNHFSDVSNDNPFCAAINALAAAHIVGGYTGGTFQPTATITRQAIAAFIERADSWLKNGEDETKVTDAPCVVPIPFTDVSEQNHFCGDIEFLAHNGIATGYSNGTFGVTRATTRQATAAFLLRFEQFEIAEL
jgi:hypothetical protein